jgi:hypothetical protein
VTRPVCTEAELAAVVVTWLQDSGATVYQEVECAGGVADIVAKVGPELWIVETKVSLSLALLVQAMDRRRLAHRVYCAGPYTRTLRDFAGVCREVGIGLLEVSVGNDGWGHPQVKEAAPSRRWNTRPVALAATLRPEHQTHAAAGTNGGRWTPFRDTCEQLRRIVERDPGVPLGDAVATIRDHYSSKAAARSSIAHWAAVGRIPGVMFVDGALWPTEANRP